MIVTDFFFLHLRHFVEKSLSSSRHHLSSSSSSFSSPSVTSPPFSSFRFPSSSASIFLVSALPFLFLPSNDSLTASKISFYPFHTRNLPVYQYSLCFGSSYHFALSFVYYCHPFLTNSPFCSSLALFPFLPTLISSR